VTLQFSGRLTAGGRDRPYWIAQLVGGFVAALVVAVIYSGPAADALTPLPAGASRDWGALATALFVIVICTVATDDRAARKGVTAPLLIGLFIFTDAIAPASGASFNPPRSLGPAIDNGESGTSSEPTRTDYGRRLRARCHSTRRATRINPRTTPGNTRENWSSMAACLASTRIGEGSIPRSTR
jgi:hypothetical protein